MEENDLRKVHRISAQRSLMFGNYIQQRSHEEASKFLLTGMDGDLESHQGRWGIDDGKVAYTSTVLYDYDHVLSAIMALETKQIKEFVEKCKTAEAKEENHEKVPDMVTDTLKKIWNSVFSHREINILDGKVEANLHGNEKEAVYKGRDMSDGEKVALYLIAQALCVPKDQTIIIDEPEIHLHGSIMNRLWDEIEKARQDCLFVYITHNTQFAANHRHAEKIWVKSYDGTMWDLQVVEPSILPEQLLLDILGNRKSVLFVEGTEESYDTKLYSELYKEYYVVPCGSFSSVISWTKAMKNTRQLHELKCYGIIDGDYRTKHEIQKYEKTIFTH